jgi:hypothetical protein
MPRSDSGLKLEANTDSDNALRIHKTIALWLKQEYSLDMWPPIGEVFESHVFLAVDHTIYLESDDGLQRVAVGFEDSLRALVADEWDRSYLARC